jgi:multidrug efflux pump subunit AcrA (membrane-fusion protein)
MFTIQRVDKLRVRCDVPEVAAIGVAVGDTTTVRFIGLNGATLDAKVARTSHSLDAQMRTMRVEIDLANEDGRYRPGMYVQVTFAPAVAAAPAK